MNPVTGVFPRQFHCSFDDYFKTAQLIYDATTNVPNWKYLAGLSKGVRNRSNFTDTILQNVTGRYRYSDKSQGINQYPTIPYAEENQLQSNYSPRTIYGEAKIQFQKSTRE